MLISIRSESASHPLKANVAGTVPLIRVSRTARIFWISRQKRHSILRTFTWQTQEALWRSSPDSFYVTIIANRVVRKNLHVSHDIAYKCGRRSTPKLNERISGGHHENRFGHLRFRHRSHIGCNVRYGARPSYFHQGRRANPSRALSDMPSAWYVRTNVATDV
jgi:hypothetical protein